jgi:hypothetical protein
MTMKRIKEVMTSNPSYLKWGASALANKFETTEEKASKIKAAMKAEKRNYLAGLRK